MNRMHATHNPFKHAFDGLKWLFQTQPNYRYHLIIAIIVVLLGVYFDIAGYEWMICTLLITLGLVIEAINTAIEATNNAITMEWNEHIKIAKDVSASAMLTYAIGASIIALNIFGYYFLERFYF